MVYILFLYYPLICRTLALVCNVERKWWLTSSCGWCQWKFLVLMAKCILSLSNCLCVINLYAEKKSIFHFSCHHQINITSFLTFSFQYRVLAQGCWYMLFGISASSLHSATLDSPAQDRPLLEGGGNSFTYVSTWECIWCYVVFVWS